MAKMGTAARAMHFGPDHAEFSVHRGADIVGMNRRVETGPAGAGLELGIEHKQVRAAADALIQAVTRRLFAVLAGEGPLRAVLARDLVLLGRQLGSPFGVGLDNPAGLDQCSLRHGKDFDGSSFRHGGLPGVDGPPRDAHQTDAGNDGPDGFHRR